MTTAGNPLSPSAVVTGCSSGIGRAVAAALVKIGWRVFAVVRTEEARAELTEALGEGVTPLLADVADADAVARLAVEVEQQLGTARLTGLVNNAGIAVGGPFVFQPLGEFEQQINVNALGTMRLTHALLPALGVDPERSGHRGRIVNMSSVGGRLGPPFLSAYAASKHAVEGWSKSLRVELVPYGIDVVVVGPGNVATPIWDKAERQDATPYDETPYRDAIRRLSAQMIRDGRRGMSPDQIAAVVVEALTVPRPRARYSPVQKRLVNFTIPTMLPERAVASLLARMAGLRPLDDRPPAR